MGREPMGMGNRIQASHKLMAMCSHWHSGTSRCVRAATLHFQRINKHGKLGLKRPLCDQCLEFLKGKIHDPIHITRIQPKAVA